MPDEPEIGEPLSRRKFIQASSLLALGLVYQKPIVETLHPQAALGQYSRRGKDGDGDDDGEGESDTDSHSNNALSTN